MRLFFLAMLLVTSPALAQSYLVQPTLAQCQTRSAQQCTALGCDGTLTKYWWQCQPLTATAPSAINGGGTTALVIQPSGPFGPTTSNNVSAGAVGLSTTEQSNLAPVATMGTLLPWIVTETTFKARFTPVQISAIGASSDTNVTTPWNNLGAAATVNLQSATIQNMVAAMVADGLITPTNALTVLGSVAVVASP